MTCACLGAKRYASLLQGISAGVKRERCVSVCESVSV